MKEAAVMLIVKDGLILGITRRLDKTKYGLPGGKVDPGETPKQAAIRETFEETSIVVKDCTFVYKRVEPAEGPGGLDFYTSCFYATDWEGEPQKSEEGEVAWLSVEEITTTKAAFGHFNRNTLNVFKTMFPDVSLRGEEP